MEAVQFVGETKQTPEFTEALAFVIDYRNEKISDEYATTSSLAQMLIDYKKYLDTKTS